MLSDPEIHQKSNLMGDRCAIDVEQTVLENSRQLSEFESNRKKQMECFRKTLCTDSMFNMNEREFASNDLKVRHVKRELEHLNKKIIEKKIELLGNVIEIIDVTLMEYNNKIDKNIDKLMEEICNDLKKKQMNVDIKKYEELITGITNYLNYELAYACGSQTPRNENDPPLESIIKNYINTHSCPLDFVNEFNKRGVTYVKNLLKMSFKTILSDPGDFIDKFKSLTECSLNVFSEIENTMMLDHSKKKLACKIIKYVLTSSILNTYKKIIQRTIDHGYDNPRGDIDLGNRTLQNIYNQNGFVHQFEVLKNEID